MDIGQSRRRRPRADAQRNRDRLLAEAGVVFGAQGTDAPLELIARQAGVAIGTLYGHFPTRRALVGALLRDRNDELFRLGDGLQAEPDALRALTDWARAATRHAAAYRGLAAMLADGAENEQSELHESCLRMEAFTERLTARAAEAGVIRPDVTAADVSALTSAAAWTAERTSAEAADRLLTLAFTGLHASALPRAFGREIGLDIETGSTCVTIQGLTHAELIGDHSRDIALAKIVLAGLRLQSPLIRGLLDAGLTTEIIRRILPFLLDQPGLIHLPAQCVTADTVALLEGEAGRLRQRIDCLSRNRDAIRAYLAAIGPEKPEKPEAPTG